ncbi:MAG TPA: hypothetical protein VK524_32455 [Polyangiaceae bacterium]|nr:hypothetical protein [Polyangiaceae bacterium]
MLDMRAGAMGVLGLSGFLLAAPVWPDGCQPPGTGGTGGTGSAPRCGNGVIEENEQCDGFNLNGLSCISLQYASGVLRCKSDCAMDESGCVAPACGNGRRETLEQCDGSDFGLDSRLCVHWGFASGTLTCNQCTADFSACVSAVCGDGKIEGPEQCEGDSVGAKRCQDIDWAFGLKYGSGALTCRNCGYDVGACRPPPGCYPGRFGIVCY